MDELVDDIEEAVGVDTERFKNLLRDERHCFGEHHEESADACKSCRMPVVIDGELYLLKEVCEAVCAGAKEPAPTESLTSKQVLKRLQRGATVQDIYEYLLNGAPERTYARSVHTEMYNRWWQITRGWEVEDVPELPDWREFKDEIVKADL